MRNMTKGLLTCAITGAVALGALGGVAVARQSAGASAGAPYELLAGDASDQDAIAVTQTDAIPTGAPLDKARMRLAMRRMLVGVHGEATVRARGGGFVTYTWQRGQITSASAGSLTVKSADGTSWTWTVTSDTKVRKNGGKSTSSALAQGDTAFVLGRPDGTGRAALGVVVPKRS
jgi:hypothetical protein